jgi:antitoxin ParD1/3/4
MNVVLPARLRRYIKTNLEAGRYGSESEMMSEALALLESRDEQIARLRKEIEKGRRSGKPKPFDPEAVKRRGRARLAGASK